MDRQSEAQLMAALRDFLRNESLIQQAQGLPAVAPQSAQSGNPTPQNVGQTLGPQPGDPRNVSRQQFGQDFADAAVGFGTSFADPLGIPSAVVGRVFPGARDAWRRAQQVGGPEASIGGRLASGFGAANAMLRGGAALANRVGIPQWLGMTGGGAATGAGPAIDYAAGAPGATMENAMIGPLASAALPAGMAAAGPVMNAIRGNPLAAAAGGATAIAAGGAVAQQSQPQLDPFTQNLHVSNPALAAAYQRMLAARQAASAANQTSVAANQGRQTNSGARQAAERADAAAAEAARAYETLLAQMTDQARAANPTFREAYGPVLSNRLVRSTAIPFGLGLLGGVGGASIGRATNRMARDEVTAGNAAMNAGNAAEAATASANANALVNQTPTWWQRAIPPAGMGLSAVIGGEMALAPQQWNQEAPRGSPERVDADNYMGTWRPWVDAGLGALMGASAFKGGRYVAQQVNNMIPGQNRLPPVSEAANLQRRVNAPQPPPPPPPSVVPPAPPPTNNAPIDYEAIIRSIGEQAPRARGARGPVGSNPAAPGLSYDAASNGAEMFRQAVAEHLRSGNLLTGFNASDFRRRVVEAAQSAGATEAQVPSVRVFRDALDRLQQLIASEGLSPAQAARRITATNRRGGFENFAVPVMAGGGAAAAAHHSLSQPRGDDGRFTTP